MHVYIFNIQTSINCHLCLYICTRIFNLNDLNGTHRKHATRTAKVNKNYTCMYRHTYTYIYTIYKTK